MEGVSAVLRELLVIWWKYSAALTVMTFSAAYLEGTMILSTCPEAAMIMLL